jgi:Rieske Fe-S protein
MPFFRKPDTEALWKDEFSIHTADERYVSRRQFTKFLTLASLGMFVGNLWILARSYFAKSAVFPRASVAETGEIPVGGVKLFAYPTPSDRCILVRTGDNEYNAFSQKCTHLSCAVYYERETNRLACPCHHGYFSPTDGSVLQGPPPRPLPRIVLERQGQEFVAIGVKVG